MRMHIIHLFILLEKEMTIKYRCASYESLNNKHMVPVGDLGYVFYEHGKKVLVSVNKPFMVGDHNFTRSSLTSSYKNSRVRASMLVNEIMCSVFETSSTYNHTT